MEVKKVKDIDFLYHLINICGGLIELQTSETHTRDGDALIETMHSSIDYLITYDEHYREMFRNLTDAAFEFIRKELFNKHYE